MLGARQQPPGFDPGRTFLQPCPHDRFYAGERTLIARALPRSGFIPRPKAALPPTAPKRPESVGNGLAALGDRNVEEDIHACIASRRLSTQSRIERSGVR